MLLHLGLHVLDCKNARGHVEHIHQEQGAHASAEQPKSRHDGVFLHTQDAFLQLGEQLTTQVPDIRLPADLVVWTLQGHIVKSQQAVRQYLLPIQGSQPLHLLAMPRHFSLIGLHQPHAVRHPGPE